MFRSILTKIVFLRGTLLKPNYLGLSHQYHYILDILPKINIPVGWGYSLKALYFRGVSIRTKIPLGTVIETNMFLGADSKSNSNKFVELAKKCGFTSKVRGRPCNSRWCIYSTNSNA